MRSISFVVVSLFVVVCGVGCGAPEKRVSMTCEVNTSIGGKRHLCTELVVPESAVDANGSACGAQGGRITFEPCPRAGSLGICAGITDASGAVATTIFFRDDMVKSSAGAATACANLGGTFMAAPPRTFADTCAIVSEWTGSTTTSCRSCLAGCLGDLANQCNSTEQRCVTTTSLTQACTISSTCNLSTNCGAYLTQQAECFVDSCDTNCR